MSATQEYHGFSKSRTNRVPCSMELTDKSICCRYVRMIPTAVDAYDSLNVIRATRRTIIRGTRFTGRYHLNYLISRGSRRVSSAGAIADCLMEMRAANLRSADMFNIDATIRM